MKMVAILAFSLALAGAKTPPAGAGHNGDFVHAPDFAKLWRQAGTVRAPFLLGQPLTGKPCSIPLVNVTPKVQSSMPVIPPERLGKTVQMPHVEMPAPPCPEDKRN
jgi:hypothetical protein